MGKEYRKDDSGNIILEVKTLKLLEYIEPKDLNEYLTQHQLGNLFIKLAIIEECINRICRDKSEDLKPYEIKKLMTWKTKSKDLTADEIEKIMPWKAKIKLLEKYKNTKELAKLANEVRKGRNKLTHDFKKMVSIFKKHKLPKEVEFLIEEVDKIWIMLIEYFESKE